MASIRYESLLVEQALAQEYAAQMQQTLKSMAGLNDIKPLIRAFEKEFASYIGVENAIAVNSGSDALKMALLAAGVGPGDEVIVPDFCALVSIPHFAICSAEASPTALNGTPLLYSW